MSTVENLKEETDDPNDCEQLPGLGHQMPDDMFAYLRTRRDKPVWQTLPDTMRAAFHAPLPVDGEPAEAVYDAFRKYVLRKWVTCLLRRTAAAGRVGRKGSPSAFRYRKLRPHSRCSWCWTISPGTLGATSYAGSSAMASCHCIPPWAAPGGTWKNPSSGSSRGGPRMATSRRRRRRLSASWRRQNEVETGSRRPSSGVASAMLDTAAPGSDGMPSAALVPRQPRRFRDVRHLRRVATPKSSDQLERLALSG
jgi:hypothetical protein